MSILEEIQIIGQVIFNLVTHPSALVMGLTTIILICGFIAILYVMLRKKEKQ